jgi:hypothetical protein
MELTASTAIRGTAILGAGALAATLLVAVPNQADAARPCHLKGVTTSLDSTQRFADGGILRRYSAHADASRKGGYDQHAKVIMTSYPSGAYPSLINVPVGERKTIGDMAKNQQPQAIGAIDGDFFIFPDIRYKADIEMARGPMVRDGRVLRGTYKRQRVVGIDTNHNPFGGLLAVRGTIQAQTGTSSPIDIRSVNWHHILGGGVNIYTTQWSSAVSGGQATTPRPAGAVEWVLNSKSKIKSIRSSTKNTAQLGAPVADGTRVLAFSDNAALGALGVPVGTKVTVRMKQSTDTGVKLFTAVGRGLPVVENGIAGPMGCAVYNQSAESKSARPRTFVGWNAKGYWRSFTVPGSTFTGIGLRNGGFGLSNAANVAKKLGMTYAYELDGGGSTTLYTRSNAGKWSRRDLYGVDTSVCACERPMTNGLAFLAGP